MLEMILCSLFTILPDYLYRRYVQGKRFGKEINLYTVWFELRWGITGCLLLTVGLITAVFYNHPSTTNVTLYYFEGYDFANDQVVRSRRPATREFIDKHHFVRLDEGRVDVTSEQVDADGLLAGDS